MPHEVSWLMPGKVLYVKVIGFIDMEEITVINGKTQSMVKASSSPPVHMISDASELDNMKVKLTKISSLLDSENPDLYGWTVIVTENRLVKFMSAVFTKIAGNQFVTVSTYEDALTVLDRNARDLDLSSLTD